jgi:sialate O-acetylesterase
MVMSNDIPPSGSAQQRIWNRTPNLVPCNRLNHESAMMRCAFIILISALCVSSLQAETKPHGLFSDHMVVQANAPIPVWGWAEPSESVTVTLADKSAQTTTGADGKWRVDLTPLAATDQPQVMTIKGTNTITIEDVLIGDVWLCSGQSNMEFGIFNVIKDEEQRKAVIDPGIRTFCVTKMASLTPVDNTMVVPKELEMDTLNGHWQKDTAAGTWGGFSAVGYLFGKEIRALTGKPVGLIGSHWGGTPVQAWTSLDALKSNPATARHATSFEKRPASKNTSFPVIWEDYARAMHKWKTESNRPEAIAMMEKWEADDAKARKAGTARPKIPDMPFPRPRNPGMVGTTTSLFNGMINPLIPFAIKGAIWYQGESNGGSRDYDILFTTMIKDWRQRWGQGDFPFLFVQLAGFQRPGSVGTGWADLREQQRHALSLPNTGMAVAIDVGDPNDIHPKNKLPVAQRLARAAEHIAYGKDVVYSGPVYESLRLDGSSVVISFTHTGSGFAMLPAPQLPGKPPLAAPVSLEGFEIAGPDGEWFAAKAGIKGEQVTVFSDRVKAPTTVRYAWGACPPCGLYNKEGLPTVPFSTAVKP